MAADLGTWISPGKRLVESRPTHFARSTWAKPGHQLFPWHLPGAKAPRRDAEQQQTPGKRYGVALDFASQATISKANARAKAYLLPSFALVFAWWKL